MADQDSGGISADIGRQIQLQLANLNQSLDNLNTTLSTMATTLTTVNTTLTGSNTSLTSINSDLTTINTTLGTSNTNFATVATDLATINTTLGVVFKPTTGTSGTATAGASTLPGNPAGFQTATVNGNPVKFPYYNT